MSIFSRMLEKLGIGRDRDDDKSPKASRDHAGRPAGSQASTQGGPQAPSQTSPQVGAPGTQRRTTPPPSSTAGAQRPAPMSQTDVVGKLERLAAENPQKLNWRTSIVDLMKLLGMESSLAERKELAAELGYPKDQMDDSARMNVWLHQQVLRKIAENGGNVPKELLN